MSDISHVYGCEADGCHEKVEKPTALWRPGFGWIYRDLCTFHTIEPRTIYTKVETP